MPRRDVSLAHDKEGDYRTILSGISQNVVGIAIAALAMFVVQVLMTRTLGAEDFGLVTLLTQAGFVASFATRAGMDMAVLRDVAIASGRGRGGDARSLVSRAAWIAGGVSAVAALLTVASEGAVQQVLDVSAGGSSWAVPAAALGLPFIALTNVWLAATRGLKIMRYTLYIFWAGQNLMWIVLTLMLWLFSTSATASILAYSLSWVCAAIAAGYAWYHESRGWRKAELQPGWFGKLIRYAGPRAPAALFAQLLFWTDLFVVARYVADAQVGIYSAALRAGQLVVLFLASVNLMFSPYVADLHNRGERDQLDGLYKTLTRWIVAATLPLFLLISVAPGAILNLFGNDFSAGKGALLILVAGQFINIATGSAGFILIMVGRTGWDLVIYAGSVVLNLALAFWLSPRYGIEGAAVANAITFGCSNVARLLFVKHFVRIQPYDARYLRLVIPAAAGAVTMWVAHRAVGGGFLRDLLITGIVGGLGYFVVYGALGLTPTERSQAARFIRGTRASSSR